MANTTGLTNKIQQTPWTTDRRLELGCETVASTTFFYDGQAVGRDSSGNMVNMDDTAACEFIGVLQCIVDNEQVNTTDKVGDTIFRVLQPQMIICNIAAAAAGDEGKKVFWQYNETVAYNGLTNFNLAGTVWQVLSATQVVVLPPWLSRTFGGQGGDVATLPGPNSGTTTFTKYNINRNYICNDTASLTINLPVSTTVSPGDQVSFWKIGSGANTIKLAVQGTDSINSATTTFGSTTVQFNKTIAQTDGNGNWYAK